MLPALVNRLIRLAAFQNPEFYAAQAMRLPTFGKPRMISCAELFVKRIALHSRRRRPGSVRIEDRLIGSNSLANCIQLRASWLVWIFRRRQAAELQQTGHQQ